MKVVLETQRLILTELDYTDDKDLFEMDSDPKFIYISKIIL